MWTLILFFSFNSNSLSELLILIFGAIVSMHTKKLPNARGLAEMNPLS